MLGVADRYVYVYMLSVILSAGVQPSRSASYCADYPTSADKGCQDFPTLPKSRRPRRSIVYSSLSTTANMATELAVQSERAYQKQPHIFQNHKKGTRAGARSQRTGKGGRRWFKDVGLGFKTPKNAIEGDYIGA